MLTLSYPYISAIIFYLSTHLIGVFYQICSSAVLFTENETNGGFVPASILTLLIIYRRWYFSLHWGGGASDLDSGLDRETYLVKLHL